MSWCSFIYSDASQHAALQGTKDCEEWATMYDIICITICHIINCWHKSFLESVPMLKKLLMLLPRMHMYAHKNLCQAVYSLAYAVGFGLTHEEGVKIPWAELNISSLSMCKMSGRGCEDVLNSLFGSWNWRKTLGMGTLSPSFNFSILHYWLECVP